MTGVQTCALPIFEIGGVPEETAREAMRLASYKLPVKCKFIKKEGSAEE